MAEGGGRRRRMGRKGGPFALVPTVGAADGLQAGDVGAGAKVASRAGHHDDAHGGVLVGVVQGPAVLDGHRAAPEVAALGAVECDQGHARVDFVGELLELRRVHDDTAFQNMRRSSSWSARSGLRNSTTSSSMPAAR